MKATHIIIVLLLFCGIVAPVLATTTTFYLSEDTADRYTREETAGTFTTLRAAAGDTAGDPEHTTRLLIIRATSTANQYNRIYRNGYGFNTSSIPDTATITGITFGVNVYSKTNGLGNLGLTLTGFNPITNNSFIASDYARFTDVRYTNNVSYADVSTAGGYTNFTGISAWYTAINKTGYSNFFIRFLPDLDNSATAITWASAGETGFAVWDYQESAGKYPFLEITYTEADTTPPASVTNLAADNSTCTEMDVSWTEPADADLNHTMMYKDNVLIINETNATTNHVFTGLTGGQSYTFSTKTCDTSGNCNTEWVNVTESATACGSAPVASFTSDRLMVRIPNSLTLTETCENVPTLWNWSWGDGTWTNGTTETPSHQYLKRGLFTTYLIASNAFGTDTSDTQTVRVVGYANE